jgi:hypothetical protein
VAYGELGKECAAPLSSNSRFAGEDMIDSEVIRLEMTSGEAGWTCTRFPSGGRSFNDGGGSDPRRPSYLPSYLVRSGMGGGVEGGAILASWWHGTGWFVWRQLYPFAPAVISVGRLTASAVCSVAYSLEPCVSYQSQHGCRCEVGQKRVLNARAHYALNFDRIARRLQRATARTIGITLVSFNFRREFMG